MSAALKSRQTENPERTKELRRRWYAANRDHELLKASTYKTANPVSIADISGCAGLGLVAGHD